MTTELEARKIRFELMTGRKRERETTASDFNVGCQHFLKGSTATAATATTATTATSLTTAATSSSTSVFLC